MTCAEHPITSAIAVVALVVLAVVTGLGLAALGRWLGRSATYAIFITLAWNLVAGWDIHGAAIAASTIAWSLALARWQFRIIRRPQETRP